MERVCFTMRLKQGMEAQYDEYHRTMWPEFLGLISSSGQRNYSIFRDGCLVVGYLECVPDRVTAWTHPAGPERDLANRWGELMAPLLETTMRVAEEVWHVD